MIHEISQFEIPDHQLLAINAPRVGAWTEIGKAEITHTIFGRAKVRIIRKDDQARRTRMLLATLAAIAFAAVAWVAWLEFRQTELAPSTEILSPVAAPAQSSAPAAQAESVVPPAAPPPVEIQASTPPAEIKGPAFTRKSAPPQPSGVMADEQAAARVAPARQPEAGKMRVEPVPADNSASRTTAEKPVAPKVLPPSAVTPPVIAAPRAAKTVESPAAASPAAVSLPAVPPVKQDTPATSPAADKQPSSPASVQSK
jgi:hypothetical protein